MEKSKNYLHLHKGDWILLQHPVKTKPTGLTCVRDTVGFNTAKIAILLIQAKHFRKELTKNNFSDNGLHG